MKWFYLILILSLGVFDIKAQKSSPSTAPTKGSSSENPGLGYVFPSFPGGNRAFSKFLTANLKRPNSEDVQGKVFISFFVEKDGRLTGFKVERSLGKEFDNEALRVLRKSPKWIPAMKDGKPLRLQYTIPINFTMIE